jgi:hypothetical protein
MEDGSEHFVHFKCHIFEHLINTFAIRSFCLEYSLRDGGTLLTGLTQSFGYSLLLVCLNLSHILAALSCTQLCSSSIELGLTQVSHLLRLRITVHTQTLKQL